MTGEQLEIPHPLVLNGEEALRVGVASLIRRNGTRYVLFPSTNPQERDNRINPDELALVLEERKQEAA